MAGIVLHKNAGGHPPALGGPSIRGYRVLYSMTSDGFQTRCSYDARVAMTASSPA